MPTPSTIRRVPASWTSTKPVANVPTMLPSVESAYTLPTRPPLWARSRRVSLITTGETMPRMKLGGKKISVVMTTMRRMSSDARSSDSTPPSRLLGSIRSPVGMAVAMLISGKMARLASPPATSRMPSVRRSGQRSAMRPPR